MAKAARRYDLYLPLTFNDGRPVPDSRFDSVEQKLLKRFGGVTSQQRSFPLRGIWQGERRLYLDDVIVITALDFRARGSSRYIGMLKQEMLRDFKQVEILITESSLWVH
jgi:hypothetical protein